MCDDGLSPQELVSLDRALDAAHKNGAAFYPRQYRSARVADGVRAYLASCRGVTSTVVRLSSGGAVLVVDMCAAVDE